MHDNGTHGTEDGHGEKERAGGAGAGCIEKVGKAYAKESDKGAGGIGGPNKRAALDFGDIGAGMDEGGGEEHAGGEYMFGDGGECGDLKEDKAGGPKGMGEGQDNETWSGGASKAEGADADSHGDSPKRVEGEGGEGVHGRFGRESGMMRRRWARMLQVFIIGYRLAASPFERFRRCVYCF